MHWLLFNGTVLTDWWEANLIPLFDKGGREQSDISSRENVAMYCCESCIRAI